MSSKDKQQHGQTASNTAQTAGTDPFMQQLPIRLVKNADIKSNVMRFNATDFVPIEQWQNLKMWREKTEDQQQQSGGENINSHRPRKRHQQESLKNKTEHLPWILNINGKKGRKFRGTRSGGMGQHSTYYVFNTASDGAIEAQRLDEFYNFQSISRFTPLTAEEAEEEYKRRKRVLNMFSIMTRKRLLGDDKEEEEQATVSGNKKPPSADLKITDVEEWMSSSDCDSDAAAVPADVDQDDLPRAAKKSKKRKNIETKEKSGKKSKPEDFIDEKDAFEESDDGDVDGREMDYESGSSEGEPDVELKCAMKSVAEEDALRKLLTSDGEEEEESVASEKEEEEMSSDGDAKEKSKKSNTDTEEKAEETVKQLQPILPAKKIITGKNKKSSKANLKKSRNLDSVEVLNSATKRSNKIADAPSADPPNEKQIKEAIERPTTSTAATSSSSMPLVTANTNDENSHLEEITKRYLSRKPISAVELLHKMKSKYSYLPNEKLLEKVTQVLKKINPVKSVSKGKMFFSLKKDN